VRVSRAASIGLIVLSCFGIHKLREALLPRFATARDKTDTYGLPSPDQVVVASLGYRAWQGKSHWYFDIGSGMDKIVSEVFNDGC